MAEDFPNGIGERSVHGLPNRIWPAHSLDAPSKRNRGIQSFFTLSNFWNLLGILALVWFSLYWNYAIKKWHVKSSPGTWFAPYQFVSLDFLHNYQAARFWINGGDPFRESFGDPIGRKLCYPPIVLVAFSWCALFPVGKAIGIWTITLAIFAAAGALAAWYSRRELALAPVPLFFALAAVVTCAPVGYAMERGNYDLLLVPYVLLAAWGLRRTGWLSDALVGYALGVAICLKVYPGLLLIIPLLMRRWRALGLTALVVAACLCFQAKNLPIFMANLNELAIAHNIEELPAASLVAHSIPYSWKAVWDGTRLGILARIPGSVAALGIVGGLLIWVSWSFKRSQQTRTLILPFALWIMAAATFIPKVSNDYNLVFLPMAMLAVWDRRDSVLVHVGLGFACLTLQPLPFAFSPSVAMGFKVLGLVCCARSLVNRTNEASATTTIIQVQTARQPSAREGVHVG